MTTGVRVKAFLVELEDGSLIYREATKTEEKPKAKRGRPRKSTASKTEPVKAEAKTETKKPRFYVPLRDCAGVMVYTKNDGSDMVVAIYKHGKKKNGTPWYLCLFISKDNQFAYSYSKAWFAAADKIKEIDFFTEEEKIE